MCSKLLKKVHNPNVIIMDEYSDSSSSVLCIVMDHNPDMGYYYKNPGRIEDKTTFINQFKRLVTTYSYTDKNRKRTDTKKEAVLQSYAFTLPENTVSGKCEPNSPICKNL
ncbi:hypothetical protein LY90DRAFT_517334 [Neocallimastix californiae]|uniref:Uncharacterized protein n=1 Tax=Neocallimastix californiae TaxID=1754190 RepID=A0A1Y2A9C2_9FUNG|nr:hypothetical protein LY90DRAFT_517334 [Neocallimastix californiae]|eukprot:ORY19108.1 hypothetical protein LY90DRAFT_517334 [Neocallimastix californiae]